MTKTYIIAILTIGIILVILGFVLGFEVRDNLDSDIFFMDCGIPDPLGIQVYCNDFLDKDPHTFEYRGEKFTRLDEDGKIGGRTLLVWEWVSAMEYKL